MQFQITGALSSRDTWVLNWIKDHGAVAVCEEPALLEYAEVFQKKLHYIKKGLSPRCESWEKKLASLFERGLIVREKRPSMYTRNMEIWHYGIPGRDKGEFYRPPKESGVTRNAEQ